MGFFEVLHRIAVSDQISVSVLKFLSRGIFQTLNNDRILVSLANGWQGMK